MRIAFAGTPAFAATALAAILQDGHQVPLVLTQPDRPAGRGMKARASAVSALALTQGLARLTPVALCGERAGAQAREALERLRAADADLLVVAAYGLILPQAMLDLPIGVAGHGGRVRALNIHASLLPRWRGAAPVARAIEAGDERTGITLMQMQAGLDTGPMLACESMPIGATDSCGELTARLAVLGARMIVAALREAPAGAWSPRPQPLEGVSYARKLDQREAWLDWMRPAAELQRRVRAFDPDPGACGRFKGAVVKVWSARVRAQAHEAEPGTVLAADGDGLCVACGRDVLVIEALQRAGGRRLAVRDFLTGTPVAAGERWMVPEPLREAQ